MKMTGQRDPSASGLFFELNPGISNHYGYTVVEKGGEGFDKSRFGKWIADGVLVSGSLGIQI
jgi:hypothetical protein